MPLRSGDRVGRYELAELLGRGGMGQVYAAHDTLLQRRVALKVLLPEPTAALDEPPRSSAAGARVLREARAAARITHPNAVAIFDVGEADGVAFLAMELIKGRMLRALVGDDSVPVERRVRWLVEIARALGAAHALGLVHRDIKPENVMIQHDDGVKVLDFGIARRTVPTMGMSGPASPETYASALGTLTAEGVIVGTPMYMAPEQMRGEALDGRADQFSWGVLAYELLTGKTPWSGSGVVLVSQILSLELSPIAGVAAPVDAVVQRALSRPREDRFPTMEELADELEPHAATGAATQRSAERASIPVSDPMALAPTESMPSLGSDPRAGGAGERAETAEVHTRPSPGSRRGIGGAAVVGGVLMVMLAGGVGGSRFLTLRRAERGVPLDGGGAVVEEAQSQMSANAEATAAYRSGMQSFRNAALSSAANQLDRSIELDPLFAAAHLRRALLGIADEDGPSSAFNEDLQDARNSRATLGDHDRLLLDAFEPWTLVPPDLEESRRRLEADVQKYPADSEFPVHLGLVLDEAVQPALAAAAFDLAIARDPSFALAWQQRGVERLALDDVAGATAAYEQCLKLSPGGTSCITPLAVVQANDGKCEELVGTSQRLVALAPDAPVAYFRLAEGLWGSGAPVDAVRAALEQKWQRLPSGLRPIAEARDEAALAILRGDFSGAEHQLANLAQLTESDPDESSQVTALVPRMLLNLEMGRPSATVDFAERYLRRRSAWSVSNGLDPSIFAYAMELAGGAIDRARFNSLRDAWLARNHEVAPGYLWFDAHALPATTPEDAVAALAAMPDVHPLVRALSMNSYAGAVIGRTYLLAGRPEEAIRYLTQSSRSCSALEGAGDIAIYSTWATFYLGRALEARGEATNACAAYQSVIARWGTAKPASVTAAKAAVRGKVLHCER